jgi:DNA-binding winged helix-turn-helix (wHTH) protein
MTSIKLSPAAVGVLRRCIKPALGAAGAAVAAYLLLVTWAALAGPWLGFRWHPSIHPTIQVVFPNTPAAYAGLEAGDRLISVDGLPLSNLPASMYFDANIMVGRSVRVEVDRAGERKQFSIAPIRAGIVRSDWPFIALFLVIGWFTCWFGFWIAWRRPADVGALLASLVLVAQGMSYATCAARGFGTVWRDLPPGLRQISLLATPVPLLFGPLLLLFMTQFPRRGSLRVALWISLPAFLICPFAVYFTLYAGLRPHPDVALAAPAWLVPAQGLSSLIAIVSAVATGITRYRREQDLNHRRRLKVILVGCLISMVGGLTGEWLSLNGWKILSAPALTAASAFCAFLTSGMALSFEYAVLRHRLFDLSIIIRLGIRYALSKGLILSVAPACSALFVIDILRQSERPLFSVLRHAPNFYLFLVLLVVLAHTQRQRWVSALDRRFYRSKYDGCRVLGSLIAGLRPPVTRGTAAKLAVQEIYRALQPEWAAIVGHVPRHGADCLAISPDNHKVPIWIIESAPADLARGLGKAVHVGPEASWFQDLSAEDRVRIQESGADLLVPIAGVNAGLMIILGPKRSEEPFSQDDRELLIAVAHAIELAVDQLPRPAADQAEGDQYSFGPFVLDPGARLLRHNGESVSIGAKSFDLLVFMIERRGQVISKNELLDGVWPESVVEEANLAQHISLLRRTLGEKPGENRFIATVPGRGYSFVAALQRDRSAAV